MSGDTQRLLRLGTRKSALALAQAEEVRQVLREKYVRVEFVPITTSGDRFIHQPLADIGGKALFTKEIEEALLADTIDIAVHSLKDVPVWMPDGLMLGAVLPRRDARDALISTAGYTLKTLPPASRLGTSSPRRMAQAKMLRPDIIPVPLRGNVPGRLEKVRKGEVDAAILALAGLLRLNLLEEGHTVLQPQEFLPAASQGIIGIQCRENDIAVREILSTINDASATASAAAERAVLEALGGSCYTPVAAYAAFNGNHLVLESLLISPDGKEHVRARRQGSYVQARELGLDAGHELRQRAGAALQAVLEG